MTAWCEFYYQGNSVVPLLRNHFVFGFSSRRELVVGNWEVLKWNLISEENINSSLFFGLENLMCVYIVIFFDDVKRIHIDCLLKWSLMLSC